MSPHYDRTLPSLTVRPTKVIAYSDTDDPHLVSVVIAREQLDAMIAQAVETGHEVILVHSLSRELRATAAQEFSTN